jgi:hypothetical protein
MDQFDGWNVHIAPPDREAWNYLFGGDERNVDFVRRQIVEVLPLLVDGLPITMKPLCDAWSLRGVNDSLMAPDATLFSPNVPGRQSIVVEPAAYRCHRDGRSYHLLQGYTPNRDLCPPAHSPACHQCGSMMFIESARSWDDITLRRRSFHRRTQKLPEEWTRSQYVPTIPKTGDPSERRGLES